eukprot:364720-Chlamydomonas_euryale.AAC.2
MVVAANCRDIEVYPFDTVASQPTRGNRSYSNDRVRHDHACENKGYHRKHVLPHRAAAGFSPHTSVDNSWPESQPFAGCPTRQRDLPAVIHEPPTSSAASGRAATPAPTGPALAL